ncbi:uncharacterized protein BCR38DRAFT_30741 [Pseudomassariella vexata]|uniref:Uncharacterized protein n=1 Tax=Pseudomassariella vexata TaxID=1141098 RepID=A0A1Y2DQ16_9PEZI|nr:uncharacterized protein BCR38DRAFT_30741 [Pseudomassariella vexata]ORY61269.1 hypothetical protein BCR38DRAFT_30741 [Pseudomassariella vexata]
MVRGCMVASNRVQTVMLRWLTPLQTITFTHCHGKLHKTVCALGFLEGPTGSILPGLSSVQMLKNKPIKLAATQSQLDRAFPGEVALASFPEVYELTVLVCGSISRGAMVKFSGARRRAQSFRTYAVRFQRDDDLLFSQNSSKVLNVSLRKTDALTHH